MPETIIGGVRNPTYLASFTFGAIIAGFDIRTSAYRDQNQANATVRAIPWAPTYSIVVQVVGLQPRTRQYNVVVYREADYVVLESVVGLLGVLVTPREPAPAPPGTVNAVLMSVRRGDMQNPADATGELTAELEFTMVV